MRRDTPARFLVLAFAVLLAQAAAGAPAAPPEVLFCAEIEGIGEPVGLTTVAVPEAAGGMAASLSGDAWVAWGLRLDPGEYTLLFSAFAPAGDQDGLFVTIAGRRQRFTVPIGRWGQCAMAFTTAAAGPVGFTIDGQEPGARIDRCAVVRGTVAVDRLDIGKVALTPGGERYLPAAELPHVDRPCRLAQFPPADDADNATRREDFDAARIDGVEGRHGIGEGPWGPCLVLGQPDGRFTIDLEPALRLAGAGTVEWWVRPRPALHAWSDQGWRYLFHAQPAPGSALRLDLSRSPGTELALRLSGSGAGDADARIATDTRGLDPEAWHHILVSWERAGDVVTLWLLVDGRGRQRQWRPDAAPGGFRRLVFGNAPPDDGLPFLPMDGAIDRIRIGTASVRQRLAR
ncbi:MAG: LamG domain-containing protein [Lentisphaerae bacterium]|nr:LamG domain-containing protein [Lentisphaerota bacterium]